MQFKNLCFNSQCHIFLENIEKDYGKEIVLKYEDFDEHIHGQAKCEKGLPIIILNKNTVEKEDIIIHEAYHLRLQYDGMPIISCQPSNKLRAMFDIDYYTWFNTRFWDKINHHYFFPKIKNELNIDPYDITKKRIDRIIENNKFDFNNIDEINIISYIFQTWVEIDDKTYLQRLKDLIKRKYNSKGINKGEHLIKIMQDNPLVDFKTCIKVYEKIFNFLHKEQNKKIFIPKAYNYDSNCKKYVAFSTVDYIS